MRQLPSPGLIALLNSGVNLVMADLYTFTLINGSNYRYTSADADLKMPDGYTYSSSGPLFERQQLKMAKGTQVDTLDISITADASKTIAGVPWLTALRTGAFDGAYCRVDRFLSDSFANTANGPIPYWFYGRVAPVTCGKLNATIQLKSPKELFNVQVPRNVFQSGCLHVLYDAGCSLSKAAFGVNGIIGSGATTTMLPNNISRVAGYFNQGTITFTSGVNNGVTRGIKSYVTNMAALNIPLQVPPAAGDTFTIYPGCDHTKNTCQTKFNNIINFRGHPFVPVPESVA
jgi:uncharacterized phage protein (TIGR02218 family)